MSASLILQDVDSLEYRSYSTVSHAYGTTSDFYSSLFDQDRLGISLENNISLTVAQKQKFTIHEISPEWCYTSEGAKVYVTKINFSSFCCIVVDIRLSSVCVSKSSSSKLAKFFVS